MEAIGRAVFGALLGGVGALLMLGVGLLRALGGMLSRTPVSTDGLWPGILLYPAGFMTAGAVIGIAWPLQRSTLGRYGLGVLGAGVAFLFIMHIIAGPIAQWDGTTYFSLAMCTIIFGPLLGYLLRNG